MADFRVIPGCPFGETLWVDRCVGVPSKEASQAARNGRCTFPGSISGCPRQMHFQLSFRRDTVCGLKFICKPGCRTSVFSRVRAIFNMAVDDLLNAALAQLFLGARVTIEMIQFSGFQSRFRKVVADSGSREQRNMGSGTSPAATKQRHPLCCGARIDGTSRTLTMEEESDG